MVSGGFEAERNPMKADDRRSLRTQSGYCVDDAATHSLAFIFRSNEGSDIDRVTNQEVCDLAAEVAMLLDMDGVLSHINTACSIDIDFGSSTSTENSKLKPAVPILKRYIAATHREQESTSVWRFTPGPRRTPPIARLLLYTMTDRRLDVLLVDRTEAIAGLSRLVDVLERRVRVDGETFIVY